MNDRDDFLPDLTPPNAKKEAALFWKDIQNMSDAMMLRECELLEEFGNFERVFNGRYISVVERPLIVQFILERHGIKELPDWAERWCEGHGWENRK